MNFLKKQIKSFGSAINGIMKAMAQEFHVKIHVFIATLILILSVCLGISKIEWMIITLSISSVISLEIINSAIERLCDKVTTEIDPLIKLAKDMAAGAVLIAAISSVIIGSLIFIPKFMGI